MPNDGANSLGNENLEALDKLHCFGSRWFCVQMQEIFNAQTAILKEIAIKHHDDPTIQSVLPLLHGLHTTSDAISLLRRDGLLNEAHVLMRLLTERAINLCYQLVAPANTATNSLKDASNDKAKPNELAADDLIKAAENFRFSESYDSKGLETKINTIAANTKIPLRFLRLMISSHYPQASLALNGSASGAIFHLHNMTESDEDHIGSSFAALLFGASSLQNYVIQVLGMYGVPESLIKESDACSEAAAKIMVLARKPVASKIRDAYGWWQTQSDHEYFAAKKLDPLLRDFESAFSACIEAGIDVPILAKCDPKSLRLQISALYLKRVLNDLRSVWLMIRQGNTSQAGSIAASLFENALLIQCISENEAKAIRMAKTPTAKWPWDIKTMCRFVNDDDAKRKNRVPDQAVADAHYAHYSWLCQIKHPTLGYVRHDSGSTHVVEQGYVVLPFPDIRDEDWPVKRKILLLSLFNTELAIKAFARGGEVKEGTPNEIRFRTRLKTVAELVEKHLQQTNTLP
jgi:hypothetical protein